MRLAFYTVCISPHQLPLARELVKRLGAENFLYICYKPLSSDREKLGWSNRGDADWILQAGEDEERKRDWLEHAEVLFTYIRDLDLMERRSRAGLTTIYCGERWLKPLDVSWGMTLFGRLWNRYSGRVRMLIPGFRRMVARTRRLAFGDNNFKLYPIGVHARADFVWLGMPESKMTTWGYFVEPSTRSIVRAPLSSSMSRPLRVLWVGRMIKLKNVDVIIRAFKRLDPAKFSLTLVGTGPCENALRRLASGMTHVFFLPPVPIAEVRTLMQSHDVFVFPSNGFEGWGAVVSEAMEEGMICLGTNEAGASGTMLPKSCQFHSGDVSALLKRFSAILAGEITSVPIGPWSASESAYRLIGERC